MVVFMRAEGPAIELYIMDEIGQSWPYEGVTAPQIAEVLKGKTMPVNFYINSYGGDVLEGLGIYNTLKSYPGGGGNLQQGLRVLDSRPYLYGGETRKASETSLLMVHEACGMPTGTRRKSGNTRIRWTL